MLEGQLKGKTLESCKVELKSSDEGSSVEGSGRLKAVRLLGFLQGG